MAFQGTLQIGAQDLYTTQTDNPGTWLGQKGQTQDGRTFVYSLNAVSAALTPGKTVAAVAATANHQSRTLAVGYAARSTSIVVPLGATAATFGQYQYGYIVVVSGTGAGWLGVIKSNTAAAASASTTITLDNKNPLPVALDTTSVVSLYPNPWLNVTLSAASQSQNVVGVPVVGVPVANYFWAQTNGYCSLLTDSAAVIAKGSEVVASTVVAGAMASSTTTNVGQTLGFVPEATVASQYQPVVLQVV